MCGNVNKVIVIIKINCKIGFSKVLIISNSSTHIQCGGHMIAFCVRFFNFQTKHSGTASFVLRP